MKKISSEVKIKNDFFKIKIGTTDKKNPEVVYIELGSYIMPTVIKDSYKDDMKQLEQSSKSFLKSRLQNNSLCNNDFILISDIANDRIAFKKKSYLEFQIYMKPLKSLLDNSKDIFKTISSKINDNYVDVITDFIGKSLSSNGYSYSKTKK